MPTINYDYWRHNEREAVQFLDSIESKDLHEFLTLRDDVKTIMYNIERNYNNIYKKVYKTDADLFDALPVSEFQEYLETRFNCKFEEEIRTVLVKR